MRLIKIEDTGLALTKEYANGDDMPPYAILSHTWGHKDDEISMKDMQENKFKQKAAYRKLLFCSTRATSDGLQHFWIDTCCIDQSNTVELTRAINSMFRWYKNAAKCYAYLSDVPRTKDALSISSVSPPRPRAWEPAFRKSRWFTRGWTLQELLAPRVVEFISSDGVKLGDKATLEYEIHKITGIGLGALRGRDLSNFSFEERMSWMRNRQTKEEEDIVYSLLGIFGVFLPLIYGEGKVHAHKRLRAEIDGLPSRVADSASMPTTVRSWAPSPKSTSTLANLRSPTRTAENSQQSRVVICYKCSSGTTHPIQLAIVSADKIMRKARNLAIMQTICTVINVGNMAITRMNRIVIRVEDLVTSQMSTNTSLHPIFVEHVVNMAINRNICIIMDVGPNQRQQIQQTLIVVEKVAYTVIIKWSVRRKRRKKIRGIPFEREL
ncbi:heterokaryon incompatibility protein-domain-containing protein [Nemania diffusa]|nr:heterokaryon incompatibility protein-domain-containing protein [Nemania diffusa]